MNKVGEREKLNFICSLVLKEIVIISDGRITPCCLDPEGKNTFSNIYEDDFEESLRKLKLFKKKLVENPNHFPQCLQFFIARKKTTKLPYDYFLKENPTRTEIDDYLKQEKILDGLVIEVTSACNLTCIGCPTGMRNLEKKQNSNVKKGTFIDIDKLKTWISPYIKELRRIRLFNYGEPLLHPGTIDFCSFLTYKNPGIELIISTNILLLNNEKKIRDLVKEQPTMIIVSLHGANQESLEKYMGPQANFNLSLQIMKKLIAERSRLGLTFPIVIWKYVLFNWNDSDRELNEAKSLARENNIDYLGFEITGAELASKRFQRGSENFEKLRKSEFFIPKIYKKIYKINIKRKRGIKQFLRLVTDKWIGWTVLKLLIKKARKKKI